MRLISSLQALLPFVLSLCLNSASEMSDCETRSFTNWNLDELVSFWLSSIINGDYSDFVKEMLNCSFTSSPHALQSTLKAGYSNRNANVNDVFKFVGKIANVESQVQVYQSIVTQLKLVGHGHTQNMMNLIYQIKCRENNLRAADTYTYLLAMLPTSMKAIIFGECVFIKNKELNGFLFESKQKTKWNTNLVRTKKADDIQNAEWYFEPHVLNGRLHFLLKNNKINNGSVLALSEARSETYGQYVEVNQIKEGDWQYKRGTFLRWTLEPVDGGYFMIRNWNGQYLYAAKGWCRYTYWNCLLSSRRAEAESYVFSDNVSKRKVLSIYTNNRNCRL